MFFMKRELEAVSTDSIGRDLEKMDL